MSRLIIGLTGGIACGKSTVSAYLREKGIPVVDADLVARQVVEPGSIGLKQIEAAFGSQYLLPDGSLNRAMLGQTVFADAEALKQLNAIIGPLILEELKRQLKRQLQVSSDMVVLDAALLLEEDIYHQLVDVVWVVTVDENTQLKRLQARNGYTLQRAQDRIASQMSSAERIAMADAVIDNNGTIDEMKRQVDQLLWNP